ncbi:hypothetical protein MSG34_19455 [Vibrio sp. 1CM2L]|uniref:hypothetical protein n=1 Tax=Vibrio sp. 1CM2L TaxID=2929166 RepID=UPI0020BD8DD8|nr:hypothetical protein [Vibrio sp. 1CM2L]MCK8078340.1 hypothetical protein [Vibrio sp. 1CM2L]
MSSHNLERLASALKEHDINKAIGVNGAVDIFKQVSKGRHTIGGVTGYTSASQTTVRKRMDKLSVGGWLIKGEVNRVYHYNLSEKAVDVLVKIKQEQ